MTALDGPARLGPGELLAALGELGGARAAAMYAALGFAVVPMHTAQSGGACSCLDRACSDPGPVARTGGGGWHLLYAPTGLGNRVRLLAGVDWRGQGGLIVAPPSQHTSGTRYTWVRSLTAALPEVPAGLRRLLAPPSAGRTTLPPANSPIGRGGGYGRAALAGERQAVATAQPGRRNATLNRAAFNLGQLVAAGMLEVEEVRATLLAGALEAGNPEAKARATINSGLAGGAAKPRRRRPGEGAA
jgi:hypothetical protein